SSSVYGANSKVPFHEDDPVLAPVSLYGATKRANELMAEAYARLFAIPSTGVRFFTVYGPWGRPDMAYYAFTRAILEGRALDVFNQGRMQRDFLYIEDVADALVRVIVMPPSGAGGGEARAKPHRALYNLATHTPVELERFIAAFEAGWGPRADRGFLPMQ